jgi:hypothetical protein
MLLLRHSPAAATVSLMAADAWFDVCTSPVGRPLALRSWT